jgi:hypothetical protein
VDGTLPVIVVTGKANGSTSNLNNANTATLTGSITDDGSSLAAATWELSGGTTKTTVAIASPGSFSIAVPAMSNHATTTVTLKAADKAGNASTYAIKFAIEVAAPTVQWLSGSTEDGFVTSSDKVTVQYSINGGSTISETINMAAPSQPDQYTTTTKTISATNAIAETVSDTRTFYRVHASVRFFSPTGKPFLDCMSWKNACSFGGSTVPGMENMTLWMTEGTYRITSDFSLPQGSALKGQLKTTSKTSSERSSLPTILASSRHSLFVTNTRLEYLTFTFDTTGADGSSKYFLEAGAINNNGTENPWVILDHCKFEGITGGTLGVGAAIHGANTLLSLTVNETTFNNIDAGEGSGGVYIYGSQNTLTFTKCTFSGRRPVIDVNLSEGKVIFDTCTPLKPKTFQELTCVGNVCSSN